MKTGFFRCLAPALAALVFAFSPLPTLAQEIIRDFDVTATVREDRNTVFEEKIRYDFGPTSRHGIYREIPITYSRDGGNYRLRLNVLGVERDGAAEPYEKNTEDGHLILKIGDADAEITGAHEYRIVYETDRAINFFGDHDELYWNVTGNKWPALIEKASFALVPPPAATSPTTSTCFTGPFGSTESSCGMDVVGRSWIATTDRVLQAGEGFTVVYGFPKSIVTEPGTADRLWQIFQDNGMLFFPAAALLVMGWIWFRRGRDPSLGTVIPEYDAPEKLSPALVGAARTDGMVPDRTVTATILDLARRGYLKIRFDEEKGMLFGTSKKYAFIRTDKASTDLMGYEQAIYSGLFAEGGERTLDSLKGSKFYQSVKEYKEQVGHEIDALAIFDANPAAVRGAYLFVAFAVGFVLYLVFSGTVLGVISAIATFVVIAIFGWFMPRRNARGTKLLAQIEGFKWFLSVTEKDRLDFHNAPERTPTQFHALLPYAIAFAVEEKWARQFASLTIPPPEWATGNGLAHLNALSLVNGLDEVHSAAASAYAPPSSAGSGGSGFSGGGSGGGFGGGGGGSW